jgi:hypothetical protein
MFRPPARRHGSESQIAVGVVRELGRRKRASATPSRWTRDIRARHECSHDLSATPKDWDSRNGVVGESIDITVRMQVHHRCGVRRAALRGLIGEVRQRFPDSRFGCGDEILAETIDRDPT